MVFAEFGTGQVFWSILWFTLFFMWIWLVITIFADIFRSPDLTGWGKALWSVFVIFMPYLGVFVYLIARGKKMGEHAMAEAQARDEYFRGYVQDVVASTPSDVNQLESLAAMHEKGVISDAEFQTMKAKIVSA